VTARALAAVLLAACVASAVALVKVRHESRVLFVELQELQRERDRLNEQWGQLQLEEATWSRHSRVERIAGEQLDMRLPPQNRVVIVTP